MSKSPARDPLARGAGPSDQHYDPDKREPDTGPDQPARALSQNRYGDEGRDSGNRGLYDAGVGYSRRLESNVEAHVIEHDAQQPEHHSVPDAHSAAIANKDGQIQRRGQQHPDRSQLKRAHILERDLREQVGEPPDQRGGE
jgi:hypothetical protein